MTFAELRKLITWLRLVRTEACLKRMTLREALWLWKTMNPGVLQ